MFDYRRCSDASTPSRQPRGEPLRLRTAKDWGKRATQDRASPEISPSGSDCVLLRHERSRLECPEKTYYGDRYRLCAGLYETPTGRSFEPHASGSRFDRLATGLGRRLNRIVSLIASLDIHDSGIIVDFEHALHTMKRQAGATRAWISATLP